MAEVETLFQVPECHARALLAQSTSTHYIHMSSQKTLYYEYCGLQCRLSFVRWIKVKTVCKPINHRSKPSNNDTFAHTEKEPGPI